MSNECSKLKDKAKEIGSPESKRARFCLCLINGIITSEKGSDEGFQIELKILKK